MVTSKGSGINATKKSNIDTCHPEKVNKLGGSKTINVNNGNQLNNPSGDISGNKY